jgi:hypothetical protein
MLARAGLKTSRPLSRCCCTDFEAFVALDAETIRNNERHCSAAVPRPLFLFLRRFEVRGTVPFQAPRSHGDDLVEKVRIPDQNHGLDGPSDGGVKLVLSKSLDRTRGMMTGRRPIVVRARGGFLEDADTLDLA